MDCGRSERGRFSALSCCVLCSQCRNPGCSSALLHRVAQIGNWPVPSKAEKPLAVLQNSQGFNSRCFLIKVTFR